jgi:transcriptional regulator with PAS, ATPase and Fis domain
MMKQIKDELQQIAETVKAIVGIDVTILDKDLMRLAGTGIYKSKVGTYGPKNSVFEKCLLTGNQYLIADPKSCKECGICDSRENCEEKAAVCFPIVIDEKVVGVIGLIIFDEEKKEAFLEKKESYIDFDKRLSELIASKIREKNISSKLQYKSKELLTVIDSVNEGIVIVDKKSNIMTLNRYFKEKFGVKYSNLVGEPLCRILPKQVMDKIEKNKFSIEEEQLTVSIKNQDIEFLFSIKPIIVDDAIEGAVITFKDFNMLQRSVFNASEKNAILTFEEIIGSSQSLVQVKEQGKLISKQNMPVLLLGESGTGKELFARAIHTGSDRRNQIFMAINCGAIPESLMESELFGYEKGTFTGANSNGKMGKFEIAKDGTIFLDEIGDLPLHMQVKLLRVLEEKELMRVGGSTLIKVNPRIIAATNKNLQKMVERNEFREDLFYRLNVIPLRIPPLRDRPEDVRSLSDYFLKRYNKIYKKNIKGYSPEAEKAMARYNWPGNVRELQNLIEYAINFKKGDRIGLDIISSRIGDSKEPAISEKPLKDLVSDYEKDVIKGMIRYYGEDTDAKKTIAKKLQISPATLYRKLEEQSVSQK